MTSEAILVTGGTRTTGSSVVGGRRSRVEPAGEHVAAHVRPAVLR
ncbi:hypothetical protein [Blastococcus sp. SYSU DS0828]